MPGAARLLPYAVALRYTAAMAGAMITSASAPQTTTPVSGFRRFWRTLRQLFHEVTGAVFALLAFIWLNNALRAWTHDVARWLVVLAAIVAAVFVFYAVSSFRRARKL
jgi:hypothetical protein